MGECTLHWPGGHKDRLDEIGEEQTTAFSPLESLPAKKAAAVAAWRGQKPPLIVAARTFRDAVVALVDAGWKAPAQTVDSRVLVVIQGSTDLHRMVGATGFPFLDLGARMDDRLIRTYATTRGARFLTLGQAVAYLNGDA